MGRDPFNRLYEGMLPYHTKFRYHLALLKQQHATSSVPALTEMTLVLCRSLEMHHMIEEQYIFPSLSRRLPQFGRDSQHVKEHATMHHALEELQSYATQVQRSLKRNSPAYNADKMAALIASFKQALLPHLAEEEESLKAKSIKEAGFTIDELARISM